MSRSDIGTTIDFRTRGTCEARHPWPEETVVGGGKDPLCGPQAAPATERA